ncbi:hypothetical protein TH61_15260 [Rufibacter sp. DG15C]|uniref:hypothetical protein n=1 Tax=Rufibacter sp. DG15C TaxID=1379909 RepID=UPI00078B7A48|nr:hypothetical protein [Rufibacter sp. DG15C]AMM52281.1 hypothetical protein TH61_15260 [Rufibacter sp. DG15C]
MKTRYLFPHRFKKLGWVLLIPSLLLGLLLTNEVISFPWLEMKVFALYDPAMLGEKTGTKEAFEMIENNLADEIIACLLIVSTLLVACSEVKEEDEFIGKLRLESLLWATYVNAAFLIFCLFFIYGLGFYQVMVYNLFTLMLLFLVRFQVVLYKASKLPAYEE